MHVYIYVSMPENVGIQYPLLTWFIAWAPFLIESYFAKKNLSYKTVFLKKAHHDLGSLLMDNSPYRSHVPGIAYISHECLALEYRVVKTHRMPHLSYIYIYIYTYLRKGLLRSFCSNEVILSTTKIIIFSEGPGCFSKHPGPSLVNESHNL